MIVFKPQFSITNRITAAITQIERTRGFLEAAHLSTDWVREMGDRALILEAHYTTHIEGTRLTLDQAERLWKGEKVMEADPDSEYYDRDRPAFYRAIQGVRKSGMDMTGWLDYFVAGLETQMVEVKLRGEQVIRRDVLVQKYGLNNRQGKALGYLQQHGKLTIQDFEKIYPEVNRRSLQRDLKGMIEKDLLKVEGSTNRLVYFLKT